MDVGDVIPDKLFVGGLASETDEKTLEDTFSKYGRIKETYIIRAKDSGMSKGYGFITFVNSDDCADAVKSMDGKDLGGNPIHVEQATVRPRINNFRPASGGFRDGPPRGRRPPLLSMARDRLENAKRTLGRLPPRSPVGGMRGRGRGFSSGLSRGAPPFRDGPPPPRGGLLSPPGRPSFMSRDGPPPSYDRDGPPMSRSSRYSRDGPPPPSSSYRSPPRSSMRGMDMSRDSGPPSSRGGFSQSRSGMGPPPRYDGDNSRDRGGMSMRNSRGGGGGMMSRDRGMSPPPQRNYRDSYTTNDSRTLDYAQSDRYNSRDMGSSRGLMSRSTDDYGMGRTSSRDYLQTSRDNYPMSSRSEFGRDSGYGRRSPIMSSHSSNTRESDMYNDRGHDSAPSRGLSSSFSSRVLVPMNSRQSYGTPPRIGPSRFTTPRSQQRGGSPSPRYNGPPSRGQPLSSDGTSMSSRGPPMSSRGPLMSSRGPPMSSRAPPMSSRGPPRSSSRSSPPSSTRGPPSSTRGPPMSSRGPPPRDGGSRRDTSSNGPPPRDMADRRGPPSSRSHRRSSPTASRGGPPPKRSRMDPPPSRSSKGSTRR